MFCRHSFGVDGVPVRGGDVCLCLPRASAAQARAASPWMHLRTYLPRCLSRSWGWAGSPPKPCPLIRGRGPPGASPSLICSPSQCLVWARLCPFHRDVRHLPRRGSTVHSPPAQPPPWSPGPGGLYRDQRAVAESSGSRRMGPGLRDVSCLTRPPRGPAF